MAAAPVFTAWILVKWGWEMSFYLTGIISLIWVVLWLATYPKRDKQEVAVKTEAKKFDWQIMKRLLSKRETLAITVIKFLQDYLFYLFVTWLPGYLVMQRHFTIMKMGIYASLPWIVGMVSQPLVGMLVTHSFNAAFAIAGVGIVLAALCVTFLLGEVKPMSGIISEGGAHR